MIIEIKTIILYDLYGWMCENMFTLLIMEPFNWNHMDFTWWQRSDRPKLDFIYSHSVKPEKCSIFTNTYLATFFSSWRNKRINGGKKKAVTAVVNLRNKPCFHKRITVIDLFVFPDLCRNGRLKENVEWTHRHWYSSLFLSKHGYCPRFFLSFFDFLE